MGKNYYVESNSLRQVFDDQTRYVVPDYQRPYNWEKVQVEELCDDLFDRYPADPTQKNEEYMLGPIVMFKKNQTDFEIIDGQQRLVTLMLLFCAFRDSLKQYLNSSDGESPLKFSMKDIDQLINPDADNIYLNNSKDHDVLCDIRKGLKSKSVKRSKVMRNYDILLNRTNELCQKYEIQGSKKPQIEIRAIQHIISDLKDKISFVRVDVSNENYSHQIFQSLNSKGQKLNQADLIKSYILKKIEQKHHASIKERWDGIMEKAESEKIPSDALIYESMLSRISKNEDDVKKRDLFRAIKTKYMEGKDIETFVKRLEEDASFVMMLHKPKLLDGIDKYPVLKHAFNGLKQIRAVYFKRPIITACREWGPTNKKTIELVDCLVKFFFMYRTICKKDIDLLKRNSKIVTNQIINNESIGTILHTILKYDTPNGERQHIDSKEFVKAFMESNFNLDSKEAMYILTSFERELREASGAEIAVETLNVEHIFPQNPKQKDWPHKDEMAGHTDRLGNLTLISGKWNQVLSNHSFKDKKSGIQSEGILVGYSQSGLKINEKYLAGCGQWTVQEIEKREEQLADLAEKVWDLSKYVKKAKKNLMGDLPKRSQLKAGMQVEIETREDKGTGKTIDGVVKDVLTPRESHPYGIMVRLQDGKIGRVKQVLGPVPDFHTAKQVLGPVPDFHTAKLMDLNEMPIPKIEDTYNEFKEFYQYDKSIDQLPESLDPKKRNESIKTTNRAVQERFVEEVCAFGNSQGGFVYLGIKDDGTVVGLEKDRQHGGFDDYGDSFANHIINRLTDIIKDGAFIAGNLNMLFRNVDGRTICIIQVLPSNSPLYMHTSKKILFCVRGPSPRVVRLDGDERDRYLRRHFPNNN